MPDMNELSAFGRIIFCLGILNIIVILAAIAAGLGAILWCLFTKDEPEPVESAIEKPERIKVMSYNKDRSLNYWERRQRDNVCK